MADFIFKNASVISSTGDISSPKDVYIRGELISAVLDAGTTENLPFSSDNAEVVDCTGKFISPGLVNLHTHSPMNIFKGIAEDADPDRWFNKEIWPYESKMEPGDIAVGTRLAVLEMLDAGVTSFADHYFGADAVCDAVLEMGIRADVAPTVFGMTGEFDAQLAESEKLFNEYGGKSSRLKLRLGPHAPYTCTPEQLRLTGDLARKLGTGIHIHAEDEEAQITANMEEYGKSPFQIISEAGLTELPLIIGHGLFILEEERKLITDSTYFAVCPKTYMKMGIGIGRVWDRPEELPLCTGTDGAASSYTLNPLEQVRLFALAGKAWHRDAEAFSLRQIWQMLMRGHKALDFNSGEIAAGKAADLVVWDLKTPHTFPLYDPLAALIYGCDPRNAVQVMIAGSLVKDNGKVKIDSAPILKEAEERVKAILKRGKGKTKLVF
jgi:5-methylthioadenosine/S-adenosylhomocysteine deaminase